MLDLFTLSQSVSVCPSGPSTGLYGQTHVDPHPEFRFEVNCGFFSPAERLSCVS